jgi:hypothetical protein
MPAVKKPRIATTAERMIASAFVTSPAGYGREGALIRSVSMSKQSFRIRAAAEIQKTQKNPIIA